MYILSVQLVVDVLIVRVFSQYDQNTRLYSHTQFSLSTRSCIPRLFSVKKQTKKTNPRSIEGEERMMELAGAGAQHQLRAPSARRPHPAEPGRGGVAAAGRARGPALWQPAAWRRRCGHAAPPASTPRSAWLRACQLDLCHTPRRR